MLGKWSIIKTEKRNIRFIMLTYVHHTPCPATNSFSVNRTRTYIHFINYGNNKASKTGNINLLLTIQKPTTRLAHLMTTVQPACVAL